jgi:acyl transferase domain-containing protein
MPVSRRENPAALWQLLRDGKHSISEIPRERWDIDSFYSKGAGLVGKMNTRWGGFLPDVENFDARFFGISPGEASSMDPQHRLLLEIAWQALENAAIPAGLRGTKTGVFVGISGNDYGTFSVGAPEDDRLLLTGNTFSIAANRLTF